MTHDFDYHPSAEQSRQLKTLLTILSHCQELGVKVWVIGGYAFDALFGLLTRDHHDYDLYIEEAGRKRFEEVIEKLSFHPVAEKAGQIGKSVYVNSSFSPPLKLELGTIEQSMEFFRKIYGQMDPKTLSIFATEAPIGSLEGQPVLTPTLAGLKKMIEINDQLLVKKGPHQDWQKKIIAVLEKK